MSNYKVGDKVVLTVTDKDENGFYPIYVLNDNFYISEQGVDEHTEPLSTYIESLEYKIRRQAAEITRLLAENKELKEESKRNYIINNEMARAEGHNEAWELARKIAVIPKDGGYGGNKLIEIFNTALNNEIINLTYPEAAAKVAEWEKAKEEIKRGDIIRNKYDTSSKFCVTDIGCDGHLYGVGRYGLIYSNQDPEYWEKTGRHIDIGSFLKQIGGEE